MYLKPFIAGLWAVGSLRVVFGYDASDSLMDGDSSQSGYLPNHNMDPTVITGGSFGQLWQYKGVIPSGGAPDQFYAKPLVYTPTSLGGQQIVLAFSEANRIYAVDAVNGTLIAKRDLALEGEMPFKVTDLPSCNDIGGYIGITGTPVIDPSTDTVYFWAKSYLPGGQTGYKNGAYRFHAIDAATLAERPGFPTNIQGYPADNDNTRWFTGGTHLQRTGLNLINGAVYAGFGGHCDLFNYTGWVVGMSTSGKVLTGYSTNAGPASPPEDGTWTGGGGGAGVWQSGAAISSDNSGRLFFATGNAEGGGFNNKVPASGRVHLDILSECIVNLAIDPDTGALTQQDYFEPFGYLGMDAGDRDLGSGGVCLPDPKTFSGGGIARLAITCGKNGICYVANADNLGGYKMGTGGGDAIVQTIAPPGGGAVFGNVGAYPLEGGYIYLTPVGAPTYVYSLGFDTSGRPTFTLVAQTTEKSPGAVGVGPATITSFNGKAGTGILWIVDTNGLRAYNAAPVGGVMTRITLPAITNPSKFQRPTFGNGRYYMATLSGAIVGFGAPVALPFTCTSPLDFGSVAIGSASTMNVTCKANIAVSQVLGLTLGKTSYQASNSSLPKGALKAGDSFNIPVTFNLTSYVLNAGSTSAPSVSPGVQTTAMSIYTSNTIAGYSTEQGITLTGTAVSQAPFIAVNPLQVGFPDIVIGGALAASTATFIIQNAGQSDLVILGYAYGAGDDAGDDGASYTNITLAGPGVSVDLDDDGYFTTTGLPPLNTKIAAGASLTVDATFAASVIGDYFTLLTVFSNGGSAYTILSGSANTSPIVKFEYATNEGGWNPIADCAIPADGCTFQLDVGTLAGVGSALRTIRFTNNGGSDLVVTKSKPPEGTVLGATNPSTDLSEGMSIPPGNSSSATVYFQPGSLPLNSNPIVYFGTWTLNTNDLSFGVHAVNFTGTLAPKQVGPTLGSGGEARYKYLGCYQDAQNARVEPTQYNNAAMENGLCQQTALTAGAIFAGTEYQTQCFYGSAIPLASVKVDETKCTTLTCAGDASQMCGGTGTYMSVYYDSLRFDPVSGNILIPGASSSAAASSTSSTKTSSAAASSTSSTRTSSSTVVSSTVGSSSTSSTVLSTVSSAVSSTVSSSSTVSVSSSSSSSISATGSSTSSSASSTSPSASATPIPPSIGLYDYSDCRSDNITIRTLTGLKWVNGAMTIELCASACAGFNYFGVEYSDECYCGNTLSYGSFATTDGRCNMNCAGNVNEICGGQKGMTMYKLHNLPSSSSSSSRVSTSSSSSVSSSVSSSTVSSSSSILSASSSSLLSTSSSSSSLSTSASSSVVSTSLSTSPIRTSTTSSSATPSASASSWSSLGCANDTIAHRALNGTTFAATTMTIETCQAYCIGKNYPFAGVEYGKECYCGLGLAFGSKVGQTGCTMQCAGNTAETCGGSSRLNVYQYTNPSYVYPKLSSKVDVYNLQGCFYDPITPRALPSYSYVSTTMTVESCVATCKGKGYVKAAVEYGQECYCGTTLNTKAIPEDIQDCKKMFCAGDQTEFCGAGQRALVYSSV
ncbi:WSC-domain-containing protein [Lophium mytilinum]|uniref:WSC-domain-containing protein n=1 Tax=Lophium mytilinum TaxID=390894 RepID=A0A6A6QKA6_9PEZI|nr:WSC-domain-containing protein [Lophium mytilinum]